MWIGEKKTHIRLVVVLPASGGDSPNIVQGIMHRLHQRQLIRSRRIILVADPVDHHKRTGPPDRVDAGLVVAVRREQRRVHEDFHGRPFTRANLFETGLHGGDEFVQGGVGGERREGKETGTDEGAKTNGDRGDVVLWESERDKWTNQSLAK